MAREDGYMIKISKRAVGTFGLYGVSILAFLFGGREAFTHFNRALDLYGEAARHKEAMYRAAETQEELRKYFDEPRRVPEYHMARLDVENHAADASAADHAADEELLTTIPYVAGVLGVLYFLFKLRNSQETPAH